MNYKEIFDLILDENDFTVGGGSSSAIVGAMACGLMGMVANLSKGKDYGYSDKEYDDIIKELNEAKANFLQGAVDDNKAYMLIVNAYKLPKVSDEEKEIRKKENLKASSKSSVRSIEISQILHIVIIIGKNNPYTLLCNLFLLIARNIEDTNTKICTPGNPIKNVANT